MIACPKAGKLRFPKHTAWVSGHPCVNHGLDCAGRIDPSHFNGPVPPQDQGGTGRRDHDKWTFPQCRAHHRIMHGMGWRTFERRYDCDTKAAAENMAARSPHRGEWSPKRDTENGNG